MGTKIKEFENGSYLEYDRGSFDGWCVYLNNGRGTRRQPRDVDYFQQLKDYAATYGVDRIYGDYIKVYEMTGNAVDNEVLGKISDIAVSYGADFVSIDIILSVLYMAMIAEENKKNTRLGKRIKRLGIHELLVEGKSVSDAANFMRGMGWREIDSICRGYGF